MDITKIKLTKYSQGYIYKLELKKFKELFKKFEANKLAKNQLKAAAAMISDKLTSPLIEKVETESKFFLYTPPGSDQAFVILVNKLHLYHVLVTAGKTELSALNKLSLMYAREYFDRNDLTATRYFFDKDKMRISDEIDN